MRIPSSEYQCSLSPPPDNYELKKRHNTVTPAHIPQFFFYLCLVIITVDDSIQNTRTEAQRALVATNDKALPELLSAVLASAGFIVQTIPMDEAGTTKPNEFVILVLDGDPKFPFEGLSPAVVVISPSNPVAMYDRGADLVVDKPIVANVLMAKIRAVLRRYGISV